MLAGNGALGAKGIYNMHCCVVDLPSRAKCNKTHAIMIMNHWSQRHRREGTCAWLPRDWTAFVQLQATYN